MKIETAGQQRYYGFIEGRTKALSNARIVWVSLLCVAFIAALQSIPVGAMLGVLGAALAYVNISGWKQLNSKLSDIDEEDFFLQLSAEDVIEIPEHKLLIAKDYLVRAMREVHVYDLKKMSMLEVGVQENISKGLFLTEPDGTRHKIAQCTKGDGTEEEFDHAYKILNKRLNA